MRICLVSEHYSPHVGGIEAHVAGLSRGLSRLGHGVEVVTTTPGPDEVDGIPVRRFRVPLLPVVRIPFTPLGILELEAHFREDPPDLIHAHHSVVSPGVACAAYQAQRFGIPTVVTFHSLLNGYAPAFRLLDRLSGWSRWPVVFSAVSPGVAQGLTPVIPEEKILILPNGVDRDFWRKGARADRNGGDFVLASTMRLAPRKRPLALVEIMGRLKAASPPNQRLRLVIMGDGPERRKVEEAIRSRGLEGEVELTGTLGPEAIRERYAGAHLFLLPSVEESFGLAALEARAAGLPVVARRGPGPSQFIRSGEDGFLGDSDEEMASFLLQLVKRPDLLRRLGETAMASPPSLDWPRVLDLHMEAYREASRLAALQGSLPA